MLTYLKLCSDLQRVNESLKIRLPERVLILKTSLIHKCGCNLLILLKRILCFKEKYLVFKFVCRSLE